MDIDRIHSSILRQIQSKNDPWKKERSVWTYLSCHELSKTRWEGQSGDDQCYHSREDKPTKEEKKLRYFSEATKIHNLLK